MKRFMNKKLLVVGVAVAVLLGVGGAAFAFFSAPGSGSGNAQVGSASNLVISPINPSIQYNSIPNPMPASLHSDGVEAYYFDELGSAIKLANGGQTLNSVVVEMDSWACESGSWTDGSCVTTPGDTFPATLTLNIYNPPGTVIASDTQTFNIRYRPSSDPTNCPSMTGAWDNSGTCTEGLIQSVTFNNFSPSSVVLPQTLVYGIAYNTDHNGYSPLGGSNSPLDSLNVAFASTGATNPSVGSDPDSTPPSLYIASTLASSEMTCTSATVGKFIEYNVTTSGTCGLGYTLAGATTDSDVPAVEVLTGGSPLVDLYPGTYQPVDFSIYNPGAGAEQVNSVTITVTGTSDEADCNTTNFAMLNGSDVSGTAPTSTYTSAFPQSIAGGGTVNDFASSTGAYLKMLNLNVDQDGCQGVTVNLSFTSS